MEVLNFMNANKNWREILAGEPYNITIKDYNGYTLLKYNQLSSDFSLPIVRESRGAIFYQRADGSYECVCRAFDKFMNYNQEGADEIDWTSAVVEEKIDGSLTKFYYHNNQWRIATNGTIDAFTAEATDKKSYGDLVVEALNDDLENFCSVPELTEDPFLPCRLSLTLLPFPESSPLLCRSPPCSVPTLRIFASSPSCLVLRVSKPDPFPKSSARTLSPPTLYRALKFFVLLGMYLSCPYSFTHSETSDFLSFFMIL